MLWRNSGDDVLVAGLRGEDLQVLSGTACHVWALLDRPRTLAEVVAILGDHYHAAHEVIARDVAHLLEDLRRRGLVDATPADG